MSFRRIALSLPLAAALAAIISAWSGPAAAQATISRIVASVNDDAITDFDLNARATLIALSNNVQVTPGNRDRLLRRALAELVDDRLKTQEAERLDITVNDQEVSAAIQTIERSNNMEPGGLMRRLTNGGVPVDTLIEQVKANLLWRKVLRRRVLPQVRVATDEVDDALNRIREAGGGAIMRASEIFLPATTPEAREEARALARDIRERTTSSAEFADFAAQYSRAPTAAVGGDLGEIQTGQLSPPLDAALANLAPGETSPPIDVDDGVYVMHLIGRQTIGAGKTENAVVTLARAFLPVSPGDDVDLLGEQIRQTVAGVDGCDAFDRAAGALSVQQPPRVVDARIGDLPAELRPIIAELKPGEQTKALAVGSGVAVMMLCRRAESGDGLPTAVQVAEAIQNQRAQRRAERYLRDLRRLAIIDIRG